MGTSPKPSRTSSTTDTCGQGACLGPLPTDPPVTPHPRSSQVFRNPTTCPGRSPPSTGDAVRGSAAGRLQTSRYLEPPVVRYRSRSGRSDCWTPAAEHPIPRSRSPIRARVGQGVNGTFVRRGGTSGIFWPGDARVIGRQKSGWLPARARRATGTRVLSLQPKPTTIMHGRGWK